MPPATASRMRDRVTVSSRGSLVPAGIGWVRAGAGAAAAAGAAAGVAGARGRSLGAAIGQHLLDVLAADPAADPGAGDHCCVQTVLGDQPADQRREQHTRLRAAGSRRGCGSSARRSGGRCGSRGCGCLARSRRRGGGACLSDAGQRSSDRNGFALADQDLEQHPVIGAGDLRIDLVGRHLEQGVVHFDGVARLLDPRADGALGDRLAQLGHQDVVDDTGRCGDVRLLVGRAFGATHLRRGRVAERGPACCCQVMGGRRQPIVRRRRSLGHRGDPHQLGADRHGLPGLDKDLGDHTVIRAGDLRIDLVGRHLEQRVVELHRVADLLEPVGEFSFGNRLAQLGHRDEPLVVRHAVSPGCLTYQPCSERPEKVIMVSPIASERLGWAWINRPTSLGNASQLTAR